LPLSNQILARSSRWFPWLTYFIRWMMRRMVIGDAEKSARQLMASIPETDKAALYTPQNMEIFVNSVREGFHPGSRGVAYDDILINRDWGFELSAIRPRIAIWQGEADVNVPAHAARYLDELIPHSYATFMPGAGHFFLFSRWEEILSSLASGTTD
jgi:pimeloyl-ACP methyl ester carboxylesterase